MNFYTYLKDCNVLFMLYNYTVFNIMSVNNRPFCRYLETTRLSQVKFSLTRCARHLDRSRPFNFQTKPVGNYIWVFIFAKYIQNMKLWYCC